MANKLENNADDPWIKQGLGNINPLYDGKIHV